MNDDKFYKDYYKYFSYKNEPKENVYTFKNKSGIDKNLFSFTPDGNNNILITFKVQLSDKFLDRFELRIQKVQEALENLKKNLRQSQR